MSAPKIRAVLVDESDQDLKYAERLTRSGLSCAPKKPQKSLSELVQDLIDGNYDVFLLDYRLDEMPADSGPDYRGGSVAAKLKERVPDLPVVLVTTEQKHQASLEHNPQVRGLFDFDVRKEDLARLSGQRKAAEQLTDLAVGYRKIRQVLTGQGEAISWKAIARVMDARPREQDVLNEFCTRGMPTRTAEVAQWLLREVIAYPGLLLDKDETRVRLGLTQSAFAHARVQAWLDAASYAGVFSKVQGRWWRGRVAERVKDLVLANSSGDAKERAAAVARGSKAQHLKADQCTWCGQGDITRACSSCRQAVDAAHCLPASVDARPLWAEPAVVCFRCIHNGRADDIAVQSGASSLLSDLKANKLKPYDANA
jgi:CheY-like chemotaxis protein